MALLPKVKLKMLPTFPSNIIGGVGIEVTKARGAVTIDMDWNEFGTQTVIPTSPSNNVLTFDTETESYVMIPSSLLGGAVAGISDAPIDGFTYGRNSSTWVRAPAEAPTDGFTYGRNSAGWIKVLSRSETHDYDTVAAAAAATINSLVNFVRVAGYATVNDRGTSLYTRVGSAPSHAGKFQSADGAWWELSAGKVVLAEQFGAKGDNIANDLPALIKARDYCYAKFTELHLGPHTYRINGEFEITQGLIIKGAGNQSTRIVSTALDLDVFKVISLAGTNISGVEIHDLIIDASAAKTGGCGLRVCTQGGGAYFCRFANLFLDVRTFHGVSIEVGLNMRLENIIVANVGANAIGFQFSGTLVGSDPTNPADFIRMGSLFVTRCQVTSGVSATGTTAMLFDSWGEGIYVDHCTLESPGIDFDIWIRNSHGATYPPQNLYFSNMISDNCAKSALIIEAAFQINFNSCWFSGGDSSNNGAQIFAANTVNFNNCQFLSFKQSGAILNTGCSFITFNNCLFDGIGYLTPNTTDAIFIYPNISNFTITGCTFSRLGTSHRYSVIISAGTSNQYIVTGNNFYGAQTSPWYADGGSGAKKVFNNNIVGP